MSPESAGKLPCHLNLLATCHVTKTCWQVAISPEPAGKLPFHLNLLVSCHFT
jgi:hypothetical protein